MSGGTIYYRKDLPESEFHLPTVKTLRYLLNHSELPDHYELIPNKWGNLAIYHTIDAVTPRDYIGYIDLHTGTVHCNPRALPRRHDSDQDNTAPGYDEQSIFRECSYVEITGDEDQSIPLEGWE